MQNSSDEKEGNIEYARGLKSSFNIIVREDEIVQADASSRTPSESHKATAHGQPIELEAQTSNPDTENSTLDPITVPREQRRGLLARFSVVAEVEEPKHYPRRIKWFITFIVALASVAAPMGNTIFFRERRHF